MFRISRFHQLMKALPRESFEKMVERHQADKHSKGFSCWQHLVAMVYAQISGAQGLRQTEAGFNSAVAHHYHLGCNEIHRSTLSQANGKRKIEIFADTLRLLMGQVDRTLRQDCEQMLYLLDSTSITLKGKGFDEWTAQTRNRNTQGMKVHVLFNAHEQTPAQISMSAANVNDIDEGKKLEIESGALYVFDKGYCDYAWWHAIAQNKAQFVTRFKYNAALVVERALPIDNAVAGTVLSDEIVRFKHKQPRGKKRNPYEAPLRRITIARPDKDRPLVLATNDLVSPALTIGQRYKDRWQIELFFKWVKQHLNIKRFIGRSENAVRIQILTALIAYLLLALYKRAHGLNASLWGILGELRATLFTRPHIEVMRYRRRREEQAEFALRQPGLFA
jgi:putative transposase